MAQFLQSYVPSTNHPPPSRSCMRRRSAIDCPFFPASFCSAMSHSSRDHGSRSHQSPEERHGPAFQRMFPVTSFFLQSTRTGWPFPNVTFARSGGRKRRRAVTGDCRSLDSSLGDCAGRACPELVEGSARVTRVESLANRRMRNPSGWCVSSNSIAPTLFSPTMPAMRASVSSSFSGSGDGGRNSPPWAERCRAGSAAR